MIKEWFDNLEATDIIALYAAFISTVTIMWNIINSIIEKTTRVKINIGINTQFTGVAGVGIIGSPKLVLSIIVTNISPFDLYIGKPMLQGKGFGPIPRKIEGHNGYYVTKPNEYYPLHLKPREQFKTDIEINDKFLEMIKKYKKRDRLRVRIADTAGKAFYSNKIYMQRFLSLERVNKEN